MYILVEAFRYHWKVLNPGLPSVLLNSDEIGDVLHGAPQVTVLLPGSFKLGVQVLYRF
jgi:hypothetical protein